MNRLNIPSSLACIGCVVLVACSTATPEPESLRANDKGAAIAASNTTEAQLGIAQWRSTWDRAAKSVTVQGLARDGTDKLKFRIALADPGDVESLSYFPILPEGAAAKVSVLALATDGDRGPLARAFRDLEAATLQRSGKDGPRLTPKTGGLVNSAPASGLIQEGGPLLQNTDPLLWLGDENKCAAARGLGLAGNIAVGEATVDAHELASDVLTKGCDATDMRTASSEVGASPGSVSKCGLLTGCRSAPCVTQCFDGGDCKANVCADGSKCKYITQCVPNPAGCTRARGNYCCSVFSGCKLDWCTNAQPEKAC